MLKSSILNLYEGNKKQLYDNAVQWKEQKELQEYRKTFNPFGWNYNQNKQYQGFNVSLEMIYI